MSRTRSVLFWLLVSASAGTSCGITGPDVDADGTVRFLDIEGGCWGIEADDTMYEPINLTDEFRINGLRVRFEAEEVTEGGSFCMIGTLVELTEIERAGIY